MELFPGDLRETVLVGSSMGGYVSTVEVVHGWSDSVIPIENSLRFTRSGNHSLHLIEGDHSLRGALPEIERLFQAFLSALQRARS